MKARIPFGKCPLCESEALADAAKGDVSGHPLYHPALERIVQWKRCTSCGHVFTEGYFSDEALQLIFSRTHENQQAGFDLEQQRYLSARIVEKVLPYASSGTWLDVGFGNGSLLFTVQEYGFTPLGLDLRAENVKAMTAFGIEAHCRDLADLSMDGACAVISMADVLEHAPYPKKVLEAARRLLSDQGVLFVSLPNMESMAWKAMDRQRANPYWAEIEHFHNFGRSRLYALLAEMGFAPVRYGISERYRAGMEVIARKKA
jgi:SAM-dependent methyltransferase